MSVLHDLVRANDVAGVRRLLANSAEAEAVLDSVDDWGETPLFAAVAQPHIEIEIVEALLDAGANVHFVKTGGLLPEQPLVCQAIKSGNLALVRLLESYGVDLRYTTSHGYNALLDAVYGMGDTVPLIRYLLTLGLDVNATTSYTETPLRQAYIMGKSAVVEMLMDAGADEGPLRWTDLHRAVAIGSQEEVKAVLARSPNFDARDITDRTPLQVAIHRGDHDIVQLLLDAGAPLRQEDSLVFHAVEGGHRELVLWLVGEGFDVNRPSRFERTPLQAAVSVGDADMTKLLLELGADPDPKLPYTTLLEEATTSETIQMLLDSGADPAGLGKENTRRLAGLPPDWGPIGASVSAQEYFSARSPREGRENPGMTGPYKVQMIKSGASAYWAREKFDDKERLGSVGVPQADPVWCADRVGQTITILPDGRVILIGGEHEDFYDPDFCIYNDVFEIKRTGDIRIFGYPYAIFPPTDFHTATLGDDVVWIIGGLGYSRQRRGPMPVFRLHLSDFHIERVSTSGDDPGRVFKHCAWLQDGRILIEGGTRITFFLDSEQHASNKDRYVLDLSSGRWSRVKSP
jgi:ankyrin repeat protein